MDQRIAKIRSGDVRALARAATGIENRDPESLALLRELTAAGTRARVVGITGPPGAGKSTLVDAMTHELRRRRLTVGIIAIDPSSRATGGAILGDRIRMKDGGDQGIFIRSMATRGAVGGLARATADMVRLLEAAGRDWVIVETVGVGQDEVDIASLAPVTVLVLVPGMGDDVQAIKAGIMEIASVYAINKADLPGADRVERDIEGMLSLAGHGARPPAIVRTVATEGSGVAELIAAIEAAESAPQSTPAAAFAIDHLGIAVPDIENALKFYRDHLGMTVASRETVEQEQVRVAMLPAGESRLELLEPTAPESPVAKFLARRGPGLHHIALRVPDLSAAAARLRAAGAKLLNEPRAGAGGHRYVFVHPASTGGVLLELIEES